MKMPKLRFKDKDGGDFPEWTEKTLGEISEPRQHKTISGSDLLPEGYPVYGANGLIGYYDSFNHELETVAVTCRGATCGKVTLVPAKSWITGNSMSLDSINPIENSHKFIYYALINRGFKDVISGSAQPQIVGSAIKSVKLNIPTLKEQNIIASFLSSFDDKIENLTKKHELLVQYKKGVMQKIFNQEVRFKDKDGRDFPKWKFLLGNEIFRNVNNRNDNSELPILSATQDKGMYPRSENGIDIISSDKSVSSYKVIDKGDYVISLRSFQGGIEYSEYTGISSPAYTVLKPIKEIVDNFFRAYFKKDSFISELNGTVVGIRDGKQISFSAFSTLELPYPCIEEQRLIADYLYLIDKKIALSNSVLNATKQYKQGLLQQMFI